MSDYPEEPVDGESQEVPAEAVYSVDPYIDLMRPRLGDLLRRMRERLGWSQRDLARATGIDQANISDIENGNVAKPWKSTLETFASTFRSHGIAVTVEQLQEAASHPPTDYRLDPQFVLLHDQVATHSPEFRRLFWRGCEWLLTFMEMVWRSSKPD